MRCLGVRREDFIEVFRENLHARSRTAKGVSDTSTSSAKQKLLKSGDELVRQVAANTEQLIDDVWQSAFLAKLSSKIIMQLLVRWDELINVGLRSDDMYREEYECLRKENPDFWRWYRVWPVSYTTLKLEPSDIPNAMDGFVRYLHRKIEYARQGEISEDMLLAFADHAIDSAIHPWADGCGRNATATVMWLSLLVPGFVIPTFGTRAEHYAGIGNLETHTAYYRECIKRSLSI